MKCEDCKSEDIHWLAWVDKDNKYIGESAYSENGEYWCNTVSYTHLTLPTNREV